LTRPRVLLLALAALAAGGILSPNPPSGPMPGDDDDMATYRQIVARVHAGEDYWDATAIELQRGHYPLRPMFTWREPLYAWLFAPSVILGRALLIALALIVLLWTYTLMRADGFLQAALAAILQGGVFAAAGLEYFSTELWAGVLIALSAVAYARKRSAIGFASGLLALFFRELAIVWCAVCFLRAEKRERLWWLLGLATWAIYFAIHATRVAAHLAVLPAGDPPRSWLALGGLGFVVKTLRSNGIFLAAPQWLRALILPISLYGVSALPFERVRLAVLAYVVVFLFVGLPFNFYWGFVYVPLLMPGTARAPAALWGLVRAAINSRPPSSAAPP
jgi:hypothetical protein